MSSLSSFKSRYGIVFVADIIVPADLIPVSRFLLRCVEPVVSLYPCGTRLGKSSLLTDSAYRLCFGLEFWTVF